MYVIEVGNKKKLEVSIEALQKSDFKQISKHRHFFDWEEESTYDVFKLVLKGQNDILGLMSTQRIDKESRIHIRLLAVSKENRGRKKQYDRIAGNLIAFAARQAILLYSPLPCLSLRPKTELRDHYKRQYYMEDEGISSYVFSQGMNLIKLSLSYE